MSFAALNLRKHSLLRGTVFVLGSLTLAFKFCGFPNDRASLSLLIPALLACYGTWETARCLQPHWSFYHAAALMLVYSDVLALCLIFFLLLYPYAQWLL